MRKANGHAPIILHPSQPDLRRQAKRRRLSGVFENEEPLGSPQRTAWHTHPLGQTLIVMEGRGWVQSEGGKKHEIAFGDIVWCPPREKHWHGATPTSRMTHIAIQESLDVEVVEWMEKVSDDQYQGS
jgi:mannose-6-phosphate isomerase-like protein (cupin superfamily)